MQAVSQRSYATLAMPQAHEVASQESNTRRIAAGVSAVSGLAFLCVAGLSTTTSPAHSSLYASTAATTVAARPNLVSGSRTSGAPMVPPVRSVERIVPASQAQAVGRGGLSYRVSAQAADLTYETRQETDFSDIPEQAESGWTNFLGLSSLALLSLGSAAAALFGGQRKPSEERMAMMIFSKKGAAPKKAAKPATKAAPARDDSFAQSLPGITPPLGFWDPLKLSKSVDDDRVLWYREAEIKHGRVCMIAALGFLTSEAFPVFFHGEDLVEYGTPAVSFLQEECLAGFWVFPIALIAVAEIVTVYLSFEDPTVAWYKMKDGHLPGDLSFDPLGLAPADAEAFEARQTRELNNGRLAMISILGMFLQEIATHQPIIPSQL